MEGSRHFVTKAGHIPQPSLPLSLSLPLPPSMGKSNRWFGPVGKAAWSGGGLYHSLFGVCVLQNEAPILSEREPLSLPYQFWERTSATPSLAAHMACAWQPEEPPFKIILMCTHTFRYTHAHKTYALSLHLQVASTQPSHIQNQTQTQRHHPSSFILY